MNQRLEEGRLLPRTVDWPLESERIMQFDSLASAEKRVHHSYSLHIACRELLSDQWTEARIRTFASARKS
jgi:hypothetical protein